MRDYGTVSPKFWVGNLGRQLRGDAGTQVVALYLMTSPHANLIGLYYCPIYYTAKETGLSFEAVTKALQILNAADFCSYDQDLEMVFVHKFAEHQIGSCLKVGDKRIKGIENEFERLPRCNLLNMFLDRYAICFNLCISPIEAPSIPLHRDEYAPTKPETETETETETGATPLPPSLPKQKKAKSNTLPDLNIEDWIAVERAAGHKVISDYAPVWEYARKLGIPQEWVEMGWISFKRDHIIKQDKKQKDWRSHFLNFVRKNWLHLWELDSSSGAYRLTQGGLQLQLEIETKTEST